MKPLTLLIVVVVSLAVLGGGLFVFESFAKKEALRRRKEAITDGASDLGETIFSLVGLGGVGKTIGKGVGGWLSSFQT